jgi:starch phosphorylase
MNMKFSLNGAVSIASRCGSNLELAARMGVENIVLFGKSVDEIDTLRDYRPWEVAESNPELKGALAFIEKMLPRFPDGRMVLPLLSTMRDSDPYFTLLDFADYTEKQNTVDTLYGDTRRWMTMSLMNIAHSGWFSSDRVARQYAQEIWKVEKP